MVFGKGQTIINPREVFDLVAQWVEKNRPDDEELQHMLYALEPMVVDRPV